MTGKTAGGWSIGIIEALTGRERARMVNGVVSSRTAVEPLTNYFVARVQRDFSRGGAGFLTTAVNRRLDTAELTDLLPSRAFVFGGDAFYFFDRAKDWVVTGKMSGSRVSGSRSRDRGDAARATALLPAPGRAARVIRSAPHVVERLCGTRQSQPQQRSMAGECRTVGCEPRVRIERPWLSRHWRSRRRSRGVAVAQAGLPIGGRESAARGSRAHGR